MSELELIIITIIVIITPFVLFGVIYALVSFIRFYRVIKKYEENL